MTRTELERRLDEQFFGRGYSGEDSSDGGFHFGTPVGEETGLLAYILIRQDQEGPYSVYTPTGIPEDWDAEWQFGAQLWEVEWRTVYEVVRVQIVRRPLRPGEDLPDSPGRDDFRRWEAGVVGTLDEVEQILQAAGKSLTDMESLFRPWYPPPASLPQPSSV